jgi:ribosomal protein S1
MLINSNKISKNNQHFKREFMPEINQSCSQTQKLVAGRIVKITDTNIYFDVNSKSFVKTKKKKFIRAFFKLFKELNIDKKRNLSLSGFLNSIKVGRSFKFILYKINSAQGNIYIDYDKTVEYFSYQKSFYELESLKKSDQSVKGYVLNNVNGGFSVGMKNLVAFVPNNELSLNNKNKNQNKSNYLFLGSRMNFKISKINFSRKNVILTRDKG